MDDDRLRGVYLVVAGEKELFHENPAIFRGVPPGAALIVPFQPDAIRLTERIDEEPVIDFTSLVMFRCWSVLNENPGVHSTNLPSCSVGEARLKVGKDCWTSLRPGYCERLPPRLSEVGPSFVL